MGLLVKEEGAASLGRGDTEFQVPALRGLPYFRTAGGI